MNDTVDRVGPIVVVSYVENVSSLDCVRILSVVIECSVSDVIVLVLVDTNGVTVSVLLVS